MAELKSNLEELGFTQVNTYLNSGNVIFSSYEEDKDILSKQFTIMIESKFNLDIPVFIILKEELEDILKGAPKWWGSEDKEIYDNLIFIMPPLTVKEVFEEIGEPKDVIEKVEGYKGAIFWSFIRKDYKKTNWWSKTASIDISNKLTIRTANTIKKICR